MAFRFAKAQLIAAVVLVSLSGLVLADSIDNGALTGSFSVNNNGQANYSVPIELPRGVGGLSPTLSFNYTSTNANGIMGMGWSLGGISRIDRCGGTIAQDGYTTGVTYGYTPSYGNQSAATFGSDKFCVDGHRLIVTNDGAYNEANVSGAKLSPETDPSRLFYPIGFDGASLARTSASVNPTSLSPYFGGWNGGFEEKNKAGQTIDYGGLAASVAVTGIYNLPAGSSCPATNPLCTMLWTFDHFFVNKITDQNGNSISFKYIADAARDPVGSVPSSSLSADSMANNEAYLGEIDYSGYRVVFNYQTRFDIDFNYRAGYPFPNKLLLSGVVVYSTDGSIIRQYMLNYNTSTSTQRSLLQKITECNGASTPVCQSPVNFTWNANPNTFIQASSTAFALPSGVYDSVISNGGADGGIRYADLNNDGLVDIVTSSGVWMNSPTGFHAELALAGGGITNFNGTFPQGVSFIKDVFVYIHNNRNVFRGDGGLRVIDYNHDGLPDLVYMTESAHKAWVNTGTSFQEDTAFESALPNAPFTINGIPQGVQMVDLNGDGMPDLVQYTGYFASGTPSYAVTNKKVWLQSTSGGSFTESASFENSLPIGASPNGWGALVVLNDTGCSTCPTNPTEQGGRLVDLNGDGLPDFVVSGNVAYMNLGGSFSASPISASALNASVPLAFNFQQGPAQGQGSITETGVRFADVNGDGLIDMIQSISDATYGTANNVFINTGAAFIQDSALNLSQDGVFVFYDHGYDGGSRLVDLNGDGRADIFRYFWGSVSNVFKNDKQIKLFTPNNGASTPRSGYVSSSTFANSILNNDGIVSFVSGNSLGVEAGTGGTELLDLNGDGLIDVLQLDNDSGVQTSVPYTANNYTNSVAYLQSNSGGNDYIGTITDGRNVVYNLTYSPITNSSVYWAGYSIYAPANALQFMQPYYVVSKYTVSSGDTLADDATGSGSSVANHYFNYVGAYTDKAGRGFLGFHAVKEVLPNGQVDEKDYFQSFPYIGMVNFEIVSGSSGNVVYKTVSTTTAANSDSTGHLFYPYQKGIQTYKYDTLSNVIFNQASTFTRDLYGNLQSEDDKYTDANGNLVKDEATSITYFPVNLTSWNLGLPQTKTITISRPSAANVVRTWSYDYDANRNLSHEIQEPGTPIFTKTTGYTRDSYGNPLTITISGAGDPNVPRSGISNRVTTLVYNAGSGYQGGVFPSSITNPVGLTTSMIYDVRNGLVSNQKDPNGITTTTSYDDAGRVTELDSSYVDGSGVTQKIVRYTNQYWSADPALATKKSTSWYSIHTEAGQQSVYSYHDLFGRETYNKVLQYYYNAANPSVLNTAQMPGVFESKIYDSLGRLACETKPELAIATSCQADNNTTVYSYDAINRLIQEAKPGNHITSFVYNGLLKTTTNADNEVTTETFNVLGERINLKDALNNSSSYQYDAIGDLTAVVDPIGNTVSLTYDRLGRKTNMSDPDMGNWSYVYNIADEEISHTDGKGVVTNQFFDSLSRLYERDEADLTSKWVFDTAANGKGQLQSRSTTNGYSEAYTYDGFGRRSTVTTTIGSTSFVSSQTYDSASRPFTFTYPSGLAYTNVYDPAGYLQSVKNAASGVAYWTATARDPLNHVTSEALGNGLATNRTFWPDTDLVNTIVTGSGSPNNGAIQNDTFIFDPERNLMQRMQNFGNNNLSEVFAYDALNRLTSTNLNSGARVVSAYYDAIGNIQSRTDVGIYSYGSAITATGTVSASNPTYINQWIPIDSGMATPTFVPGPVPVTSQNLASPAGSCGGVHRVCAISSGVVNTSFAYDANGNMVYGNGRTYTANGTPTGASSWTSYNMLGIVTLNGVQDSFLYNSEHERVQQVSVANGQTNTIYYINPRIDLGGTFEKHVFPDGSYQFMEHIYAGGSPVAVAVTAVSAAGVKAAPVTHYFHTDHIGSIEATTNDAGALIERFSYDAWGARRNLDDSPASVGVLSAAATDTDHGFTGHEMLDNVALIHMNGRIYDPQLGRFLSADPNIFYPENPQDFNRYSYVHNNPLSFTDPSGYASGDDGDASKLPGGMLSGGTVNGSNGGGPKTGPQVPGQGSAVGGQQQNVSSNTGALSNSDVPVLPDPNHPAPVVPRSKWDVFKESSLDALDSLNDVLQALPMETAIVAGEKAAAEGAEAAVAGVGEIAERAGPAIEEGRGFVQKAIDEVKLGAKRGPKTDAKAPHNRTIREQADKIEAEGGTILAGGGRKSERLIPTPGGSKGGRRPDILYKDANGTTRGRNVGRTTASGAPVKREAEALQDLNGPGGLPTDFVPYDR